MSRIKLPGCALLLLVLAGCSWVQPFVDRRRNAGAEEGKLYVGQSRPEAPVVCYNGWVTKFDELQKMADAECVKHQTGDYAEPVEQDVFTCRLLTPAAWKFKCVKKEEAEKRKTLREFVGTAIREHVLETKEKTLISYRGFDIVLPANMTLEKPYVWLKKSGKYYVELGDTDIGNLIRIDNYLDSLGDHLSKLTLNLEKLREKEKDIRFELSKGESYINQIETYKNKVKNLDKKLGVYKK